ncbi:MAG TPA: hypothetical protein VNG51_05110, partial [Ktedonobacteraceae bacterium]|nr:hypothetical protein [Ktedonobacteraceae bacterium]
MLGTVSDGGRASADGLRTIKAVETHQRDVWHVLHLAGQVQARLERLVQTEEERSVMIHRQEQQRATTGKQPTGRPAKTTASEHEPVLSQLHRLRDGVTYLFAQLRSLLEIVVLSQQSKPHLLTAVVRRGEVETHWLQKIGKRGCQRSMERGYCFQTKCCCSSRKEYPPMNDTRKSQANA